jgi:hypothetical protein
MQREKERRRIKRIVIEESDKNKEEISQREKKKHPNHSQNFVHFEQFKQLWVCQAKRYINISNFRDKKKCPKVLSYFIH